MGEKRVCLQSKTQRLQSGNKGEKRVCLQSKTQRLQSGNEKQWARKEYVYRVKHRDMFNEKQREKSKTQRLQSGNEKQWARKEYVYRVKHRDCSRETRNNGREKSMFTE